MPSNYWARKDYLITTLFDICAQNGVKFVLVYEKKLHFELGHKKSNHAFFKKVKFL